MMTREQRRAWRELIDVFGHVITDPESAAWSPGMSAVDRGPGLVVLELGGRVLSEMYRQRDFGPL